MVLELRHALEPRLWLELAGLQDYREKDRLVARYLERVGVSLRT